MGLYLIKGWDPYRWYQSIVLPVVFVNLGLDKNPLENIGVVFVPKLIYKQSCKLFPQPFCFESTSLPFQLDGETDPTLLIPTWAQPIFNYLKDGTLPDDEILARQTEIRAKAYTIIN